MLATERGRCIMSDAWVLYADAIEMLDQGRIRNAAYKAWGATKRATGALILERTGREPEITTQTSAMESGRWVGRAKRPNPCIAGTLIE